MKRNVIASALCLAMAISGLAGCGSSTSSTSSAASTASSAASASTESTSSKSTSAASESASSAGSTTSSTSSEKTSSETSAASDNPEEVDGKGYKIAFINALVTAPYFGYFDSAMEEYAKKIGVDLTILDGQSDNQVMLDQAKSLIDAGEVDGIIFTPLDMAGSVQIVKAITDAKIPLVIANNRADESVENLAVSTIACDPTYEGQVVGKLLVDQFPDGGKCAIIEGAAGTEAQIQRNKGFTDVVTESGVEIVGSQICDWDQAKAMQAAEDFITSNPDLSFIYAEDDTMALGSIEAVKAAGLTDQIKVFGLGYMGDSSKEALLNGDLYGTCTQSPSWEGVKSLEVMVRYLNGEKVEQRYVTECLPVTKDNCESIDHGYNN